MSMHYEQNEASLDTLIIGIQIEEKTKCQDVLMTQGGNKYTTKKINLISKNCSLPKGQNYENNQLKSHFFSKKPHNKGDLSQKK